MCNERIMPNRRRLLLVLLLLADGAPTSRAQQSAAGQDTLIGIVGRDFVMIGADTSSSGGGAYRSRPRTSIRSRSSTTDGGGGGGRAVAVAATRTKRRTTEEATAAGRWDVVVVSTTTISTGRVRSSRPSQSDSRATWPMPIDWWGCSRRTCRSGNTRPGSGTTYRASSTVVDHQGEECRRRQRP